jgi:hypothetical protein
VIPIVIVVVLATLAIAVALALLARHDDDELTRTWSRLVSPSGKHFRETVDTQLDVQQELLDARHALAAEAAASGTPLEAARLEDLERESRAQHHALVILRRMLSALKAR